MRNFGSCQTLLRDIKRRMPPEGMVRRRLPTDRGENPGVTPEGVSTVSPTVQPKIGKNFSIHDVIYYVLEIVRDWLLSISDDTLADLCSPTSSRSAERFDR